MDAYAVFGNPIEHSLSPDIHKMFAEQTSQALTYEKIQAPLDDFSATITAFVERGGKGANVTLPFKVQAFQLASKKSQAAIDAQAVNTLVFHDDGTVEGCNTDGMGLIQDLTHNHHYSLRQKRILILGAGGAVRGIVAPLLEQAPDKLVIANRTQAKAMSLAEQFQFMGSIEGRGLDAIDDGPYDLILQGTSLRDDQTIALPDTLVGAHTWCYDLNYNREAQTPFVSWAVGRGAQKALDGVGMLVEQAAAAFYIWRGIYPDTSAAIQQFSSA
ncbi:MAG: shikimate dehydrogenase [Coxiella sp. (in: Bacteria)]|nr:MAG: shikimate dehydrogenase [Coxiella sp. (in: g-proteobacteria)]